MSDPYAEELAEVFRRFNLPGNPSVEKALEAEFERLGLRVETSQRVDLDLPTRPAAVKLVNAKGQQRAYAIAQHPRQAAIRALRRFHEGKHETTF